MKRLILILGVLLSFAPAQERPGAQRRQGPPPQGQAPQIEQLRERLEQMQQRLEEMRGRLQERREAGRGQEQQPAPRTRAGRNGEAPPQHRQGPPPRGPRTEAGRGPGFQHRPGAAHPQLRMRMQRLHERRLHMVENLRERAHQVHKAGKGKHGKHKRHRGEQPTEV